MKCAVLLCQNQYNRKNQIKNVSFFRFPRDPQLRAKWMIFCRLPSNWKVTENCRVCSLHFNYETDLYMSTDGGRLLTVPGAVPVYENVPDLSSSARYNNQLLDYIDNLDDAHPSQEPTVASDSSAHSSSTEEAFEPAIPGFPIGMPDSSPVELPEARLIRTIRRLEEQKAKQNKTIKVLRQKLRRSNKKMNAASQHELKIFHPEQVKLLREGSKRTQKWSNEAIADSIEMRLACGTNGYNYLRNKKHYPLPSIRAIQLHTRSANGCVEPKSRLKAETGLEDESRLKSENRLESNSCLESDGRLKFDSCLEPDSHLKSEGLLES